MGAEDAGVADQAASLLGAAAVLAAYRRAGRLPGEAPRTLPEPAEPDRRPACSDSAVEVLELILSGEVPIPGGTALPAGEWLAGAARAGCRVPARLLPRLLDAGSTAADLQADLRAVLGTRGRWLARHHDRWAWAAADPVVPDAAGDDGDDGDGHEAARRRFASAGRSQRPALLDALRRADPALGRDVLGSTWARDPAAERAGLLAGLAVGLSDDDERFLDAALDDRSGAVRQVAAELLSRLPDSRRSARMADRLRPLVALADPSSPGGRRAVLAVGRPPEPDAAARRDGITDAAPAGMGVAAWRVAQIVAGAPLSFWDGHLGLGPAEVVARAVEDAPAVLAGLAWAVVAQAGRADPAWARAVFAHRPTPEVLGALPPEPAAQELARVVAEGLAPRPAVAELFAACPGPWPAALADAVFDRYRQLGARAALEVSATLPVLAARLDPSALPLVETWLFTLAAEHALRRRVQSLAHALSLRAVIHREFPRDAA